MCYLCPPSIILQTLANKLSVLSCKYNIAVHTWLMFVVVTGSLRLPLPNAFCNLHSFVAQVLLIQVILVHLNETRKYSDMCTVRMMFLLQKLTPNSEK